MIHGHEKVTGQGPDGTLSADRFHADRAANILTLTPAGLYCAAGDFHIDPTRPCPRALITHGHSDHARPGHGAVLATRGNLNNEIGVPLMLLELNASHRCAVIEMGMNHAGEISRLTRVARPDVALVNNAGHAHVGNLGSVEAVAHAKGEIFEGLARNGTAVINADDPAVLDLAR